MNIFIARFWKIADTFTGLKLKGHIGHFGKITATDIEGFVELPDGKVSAVLTGLVHRQKVLTQQYVHIYNEIKVVFCCNQQ